MKIRRIRLQVHLLAALILNLALATACAHLAAPAQLSPAGATAFHADRVIHGIAALQDVVIQGESAHVIKTTDARALMAAVKIAGQAGGDLSRALSASGSSATERLKFMAAIRSALTDVQSQLDPATTKEIAPYITTVLTALALIQ